MSLTNFPEPKDLELTFAQRTGDSTNIVLGTYDVANPHPGFGKDPNIMNEFGHTHYPKWVKNKDGVDVIVNSPEEEAEVTDTDEAPAADKKSGW